MEYEKFSATFNRIVFGRSKRDLLEKIARNPDRYVGIFRPTKPKAKIIQNLTQSNEIRFGDAFEKVIRDYFEENKYKELERNIVADEERRLMLDQLITLHGKVIFIEQKIRDDHDSTKKRGQVENFTKKIDVLISEYDEKNLRCFFFFIDDSLQKNKNYYEEKMREISKQYGIEVKLVYGRDLFDSVGLSKAWDEIISHLTKWREELPDLPEINFDIDAEETFNEIRDLSPSDFIKLFSNKDLDVIIRTLFPTGETLELLADYFEKKSEDKKVYKTIFNLLNDVIG